MEIAIWLGLLVLFGILEAATVALVSLWFMAGSLAALIAALCGAGLPVQVGVFLVVSALLLACLRPLVRRYVTPRITATNADSVIGKVAVVTEAVDNIAAPGRREGGRRGLDSPQLHRAAHPRRHSGSGGSDRRCQAFCHPGGGSRHANVNIKIGGNKYGMDLDCSHYCDRPDRCDSQHPGGAAVPGLCH